MSRGKRVLDEVSRCNTRVYFLSMHRRNVEHKVDNVAKNNTNLENFQLFDSSFTISEIFCREDTIFGAHFLRRHMLKENFFFFNFVIVSLVYCIMQKV